MNKCLYCYKQLSLQEEGEDYHKVCIKIFYETTDAPILHYKYTELEQLAKSAISLSIAVPGVQPKLSLGWMKKMIDKSHENRLTIMNALDGNYILKPQNKLYPQMPENEHLTMKLAALFQINVVPHNMIRLASGELCYITKRIDRKINGTKIHLIDFFQILELEDKYKGTMESLGQKIGELSANTLLDKLYFFELAIFNFVTCNSDMHLKNLSMFLSEMGWVLAPAYDLLNVRLLLPKEQDESALLLGGKKKNFTKFYFDRFGKHLDLNEKQINFVYKKLEKWLPKALNLIDKSFLNDNLKQEYKMLLIEKLAIFK